MKKFFRKVRTVLFIIFYFSNSFLFAQEDECYNFYMENGIKNFEEGDYKTAVKYFVAANPCFDKPADSDIDDWMQKTKKCASDKEMGDKMFFMGNFCEARFYYQEILSYNKYDKEAKARSKMCKKKHVSKLKNMIFVEGGTFEMGYAGGEIDEKPVHQVTLKSFYISKYELSNQEFADFLNSYRSDVVRGGKYKGQPLVFEHEWGLMKVGRKWKAQAGYENHPVVMVTWYGANEFCKFYGHQLPTEAQWEFAARGGNKSEMNLYSGGDNLAEIAVFAGNSGKKTQPVGTKKSNELGVHDMTGNVLEWCSDWYSKEYYALGEENDPQGPVLGEFKVARGGAFTGGKNLLRVSYRGELINPDFALNYLGFRYIRAVE